MAPAADKIQLLAGNSIQSEPPQNLQKLKDFLSETVEKNAVLLQEMVQKAQDTLFELTGNSVRTVDAAADRAVNTIMETAATAKTSLESSIRQAEHLSGATADAIQSAVNAFLQSWIESHPCLMWIASNPPGFVGLVFILLLLLGGLLRAIGHLPEQLWLYIFRATRKLVQSFIGATSQATSPNPDRFDQEQRLVNILQRLEAMRQEQDELLKEVREILASTYRN